MVQTASPVLGIVLYSLLQVEATYYVLKSGWSSVAAHHQPHFCEFSAFWIAEAVCNTTKARSQVGSVGDTAMNLAGKSYFVLFFVFLKGHKSLGGWPVRIITF